MLNWNGSLFEALRAPNKVPKQCVLANTGAGYRLVLKLRNVRFVWLNFWVEGAVPSNKFNFAHTVCVCVCV
eukprot:c32291_g1_i1 orf=1-210(-)